MIKRFVGKRGQTKSGAEVKACFVYMWGMVYTKFT